MPEFKLIQNQIYQLRKSCGAWKDFDFLISAVIPKNEIVIFMQPTEIELTMLQKWIHSVKLNKVISPSIYPVFDVQKSQKLYIIDLFSEPVEIFCETKI